MERQDPQSDSRTKSSIQNDQEIKPNPKIIETGEKIQEDIDSLVDEIDQVLEENAAEFVKNYVQKGGE